MKRRLLLFFILFSSFAFAQNNIYRSGGITQTVGAPTFTPGASGNIVAIDTVTGEWYVNPNRLSGASWISAGYRLTNISGSVPPAYTPTAHQSHFVVNAVNQLYYWNGSSWQSVGGGGGSTDALRLKFIVVNKSGGTLNKGEVVYVSGAQGNRVAVKKALASVDSLSANTLGVMDETVANNGEGYCVAEGLVSGINTSAFTEGAALYLSPTTAGGITQTKTTAPDHLVLIGYCVKSNAGSGEISVHIQNGYELGELHDVYVPAPSNGQVLTYNTTNTRWEAATVADQSATNELQTIDTFSLSGQTLSASLSSDNQPAKTVTLPIVDVVAGTNVTVTKSNGVATVSATGGGGGSGTVTGTGVAGRAAFWRSTSAISSDANFAWDSTNVQLNIGAPSSPTGRLNVRGGGTLTTVNLRLTNSGNTELLKVLDNGNTNIGTNFSWDNSNNRLSIGNPTSPAATVNIRGAGIGSSNSLSVQNSDNKFTFRTRDNGIVIFGNSASTFWFPFATTTGTANLDGVNQSLYLGGTSQAATFGRLHIGGEIHTQTSGDVAHMYLYDQFSPPSGTATASTLRFNTQINQTGGANGITRGIYLTPSLTSAADWRTIEWNNNSGYGLYGVGTANNYLAGNTAIGTITPSARLHVRGANTSSGTNALLVQNSTPSDLYKIENNGKISYWATNTAAGTTGAQTIDRPSGTVNFGIGDIALVVTNSLCTTSSIVFATVRTNDATATIKNVVPAAGSFTINLGAAATAETSVGFFIIN